MKKNIVIAVGTGAASLWFVSTARAQTVVTQPAPQKQTTVVTEPSQPQTTVVTPPAQPPAQQTIVAVPQERERATAGGPNPTLLMSGLFTFGIPYGISVVVAAESTRDGDKNLFVPVVGPWIAYATEGRCDVTDTSCGRTTGAKVLLAGDGILQAIGGIELIAAFLVAPSRTVASSPTAPRVMVAPTRIGQTGYGLGAAGTF